MQDNIRLTDSVVFAMDRARPLEDGMGLVGFGVVELRDERGRIKHREHFRNLVTDNGDLFAAGKIIQGISPASPAAPSGLATMGMKLGSGGATAASKSGAGAAVVTYITGTNAAFDATYPQTSNLGAGLGVVAVFKTTWGTGASYASISEAVICNDATTNAASVAGNVQARTVFSAFTKQTTDTLSITWNWKQLGA